MTREQKLLVMLADNYFRTEDEMWYLELKTQVRATPVAELARVIEAIDLRLDYYAEVGYIVPVGLYNKVIMYFNYWDNEVTVAGTMK